MRIYLFEHEDEEGIGLMALDAEANLEMAKVYAPNNKITPEWRAEMEFNVGLNSPHSTAQVIYVKNPDEHETVPKLYDAWEAGMQVQAAEEAAPGEPLDMEAAYQLRTQCHLCPNCLLAPLCSVNQAIESSAGTTMAVLSHCNAFTQKG
jgi:hypothetical protein